MIARRDFMIGAACALASGGALALTPRRRMSLLHGAKLEALIPHQFGAWQERPSDALIVPQSPDSLAAKLYSQTVGRYYQNADGEGVMVLIAYGDTQSDQLQLHRPEICYPAFGFNLTSNKAAKISLAPGVSMPGRAIRATSPGREEQITYWTRIGEYIPDNSREQRWDKLRTEMSGTIPDGVLVRFSNALYDEADAFRLNQRFAADMIKAIRPEHRAPLIGSERASLMKGD
jgi:EpsI family protein